MGGLVKVELQEDDVSVLGVYPAPSTPVYGRRMEMAKATPAEVAAAILNAYEPAKKTSSLTHFH